MTVRTLLLLIITVPLALLAPREVHAQTMPGDSLRWRSATETAWTSGRLIAQDSVTLTLVRGPDSLRVAMLDIQRLDRWQRESFGPYVNRSTLIGMAVFVVGHLGTPEAERVQSFDSALLTGAAVGAIGGVVIFNAMGPRLGQWRAVLRR